ncbi:MAG: histidine phosphotransferase family protein [Rhodospirillaceae bacterium]
MQGTRGEEAIGLEIVEQLCSRICHDLAGPVGAIRNGLELIEETAAESGAGGGEALGLIGHSAEQAARRLRLFRMAYGRSTADGVRSFSDIRDAALDWIAGGRVSLNWAAGQPDDGLAPRPGLAKVILNLVILAVDVIPAGGTISITGSGTPDSGQVLIHVNGRTIKWPQEAVDALNGKVSGDELGARTIHATVTGRFIRLYDMKATPNTTDAQTMELRLSW